MDFISLLLLLYDFDVFVQLALYLLVHENLLRFLLETRAFMMEFVDRLYFLMRIIRVQTHTGHFVFLQNIYLLDLLVGQLEPLFYLIPFIDNSRHFNFFYFGPLHKTKLRFRTQLLLFRIIDEILKHYGVFLELFVQRLLGQNFGHRVDVITVLLLF